MAPGFFPGTRTAFSPIPSSASLRLSWTASARFACASKWLAREEPFTASRVQ